MKNRRRRSEPTTDSDLKEIDAALEFCQGSFLAAATLLGYTPKELSNRVSGHDWLKSKWGKSRGFNGKILPFRVQAVHSYGGRLARGTDVVKSVISNLSTFAKIELLDWLGKSIHQPAPCSWEAGRQTLTQGSHGGAGAMAVAAQAPAV